jgi:hypothetical protein
MPTNQSTSSSDIESGGADEIIPGPLYKRHRLWLLLLSIYWLSAFSDGSRPLVFQSSNSPESSYHLNFSRLLPTQALSSRPALSTSLSSSKLETSCSKRPCICPTSQLNGYMLRRIRPLEMDLSSLVTCTISTP